MTGVLINTVPIVAHIPDVATTAEVVAQLHEYSVGLMRHAHCSIVDVKKWAKVPLDVDVLESILVYENYPTSEPNAPMSPTFSVDFVKTVEYVDAKLSVAIVPVDGSFEISIGFKTHETDVEVVKCIQERFAHVLTTVSSVKNCKMVVASMDCPTSFEQQVLAGSCCGAQSHLEVPGKLLHQAFEEWAAKKPMLRAVEYEDEWLSYGDLDSRACALAGALSVLGVCVGRRVAVMMDRCLELPIGLLATLKAGGTMIPLDATFPTSRLSFILSDASAAVIVTTSKFRDKVEELGLNVPVVYADSSELVSNGARFAVSANQVACGDAEAYVVYTSGSTGKPKGVPVLHRSAVNTILTASSMCSEGVRVAQFMAIGFDGCQWETWSALSWGSVLVLRSADVKQFLQGINTLLCTPTALSQFGQPEMYPLLQCIGVCGEPISSALMNLWAAKVVVINKYGPSEGAMHTHDFHLSPESGVLIGKSIPNVTSYVLDDKQRPVPVGVIGEIYVGGVCVSPGYINLREQTTERFLDDPFVVGGRMFRTGDFGRLLPCGNFEVLGRRDSQVKLKGYRVELDEVAEAMMQHRGITSAAAVVKDKTHLVGFFTPAAADVVALRSTVESLLPVYMVPAVWIGLDEMPQNANGKIDRKVLEAMDVVVDVEALETEAEQQMAAVWSHVLGVDVDDIGRNTSFFALGGDSISAIRLVAKIKQMGLLVTSSDVMKQATIGRLLPVAQRINHAVHRETGEACGPVILTPIQRWSFEHRWKNVNYWNLSMTFKLRVRVEPASLGSAVTCLVDHHDMLRARYVAHGESGWSQYVLPRCAAGSPNVHFVDLETSDGLESAILEKERSLDLVSGPVYAVTVFDVEREDQFLQFTAHHAVVDLVSWRILTDDLESLLRGEPLGSKSTSFKEWSELLATKAVEWDASEWADYLVDDLPQSIGARLTHDLRTTGMVHSEATHQAVGVVDKYGTSRLDTANTSFGTNVQELALAALVVSLADLESNDLLCLPLLVEGHGREPWCSDIDITSTVGWFTCAFPVALRPSRDLSRLVLEVKQQLRGVPQRGLSYGAIKYLLPPSESSKRIQEHRSPSIAFNYVGRFQELKSTEGILMPVHGMCIPQVEQGELPLTPGSFSLAYDGDQLVLSASMSEWQISQTELALWMRLWSEWMTRLVDYCLDPTTIGGRTLFDLPLLGTTSIVGEVEAEAWSSLSLRPLDVDDMYPATGLQMGFIWALMQDPAEYVVQNTIDIRGSLDLARLQACWTRLAAQTDILRTAFVSTASGIFQVVSRDDWSAWTMLDEVWSESELEKKTHDFMRRDRQVGFSLSNKSFHRFSGVRISGISRDLA